MQPLTIKQAKKEGEKMEVKLPEIVQSNYCYFDLFSGCVKGIERPDDVVCRRCVAAAHADITRSNGNGTH